MTPLSLSSSQNSRKISFPASLPPLQRNFTFKLSSLSPACPLQILPCLSTNTSPLLWFLSLVFTLKKCFVLSLQKHALFFSQLSSITLSIFFLVPSRKTPLLLPENPPTSILTAPKISPNGSLDHLPVAASLHHPAAGRKKVSSNDQTTSPPWCSCLFLPQITAKMIVYWFPLTRADPRLAFKSTTLIPWWPIRDWHVGA